MGSSIVRQWHLLTLLPKGPRRIDSATLVARLRERGLSIHRRTIQRDLLELATVFPLVADERSKPYGWRWADDAELLCTIPALRAVDASAAEIDLVLRVRRVAARVVSEGLRGPEARGRAVHLDEHATDRQADVQVRARVPDGCSLRRWLLGFADAVEVISPPHLRAELAARAARVAAVYNDDR